MDCFAKIVNGQKLFDFFVEHSISDVWQGSEYEFVISDSLFGKIDDTNKNNSVAL